MGMLLFHMTEIKTPPFIHRSILGETGLHYHNLFVKAAPQPHILLAVMWYITWHFLLGLLSVSSRTANAAGD